MIEYSRKLNTEAKKAKISIVEKAMADLMALGWKETDAYIVTGQLKPVLSDQYNNDQLMKTVTDTAFAKYLKLRSAAVKRGTETGTASEGESPEETRLLTKEDVLQQMLKTAFALPKTDPKRVEILAKYADLQQMKKTKCRKKTGRCIITSPSHVATANSTRSTSANKTDRAPGNKPRGVPPSSTVTHQTLYDVKGLEIKTPLP